MIKDTGEVIDVEKWVAYGAVYVYDELAITTEEYDLDHGYHSNIFLNRKLQILSRAGIKHGTIQVPQYGEALLEFTVKMVDANGNEIPLNQNKIKEKYLKTKKVIIPKVEVGCQIMLQMAFGVSHPIYTFEHWFERPIPVLKGRFSIYHPGEFKYQHKAYAVSHAAEKVRAMSLRGLAWTQDEILPEKDVYGGQWHHRVEPRVLIRIKSFYVLDYRYEAPDWKRLARDYKHYFLSKSIFSSRARVKKLVSDITREAESDMNKADAILKYVQDEISFNGTDNISFDAMNINRLLDQRKGNIWEQTVLLKEMFRQAGLSNQVYVSRHHLEGGFDPEFPSWRHLRTPLIAVKIGGKELIAYPHYRNLSLGECPFGFNGAMALNLDTTKITPLPKSIHADATQHSHATVSLTNWDSDHQWRFSYEGYYATLMRIILSNKSIKQQEKIYEEILDDYDPLNRLQSVECKNLSRQGSVLVEIDQSNKGFKTSYGNQSHYSLKPWFKKYFIDVDEDIVDGVAYDLSIVDKESVLIKKSKNAQLSVNFKCENIDNMLFSTQCVEQLTNDGTLLSRTLTIKKADLSSTQVQSLTQDIALLNSIEDSYIVEKR